MNKNEILNLVQAGFTKDEIFKLFEDQEISAGSPAETTEASTEAEHTQEDNATSEALSDEIFGKLNASIDAFTKKLENFNVLNAEQDRENKGNESLEDIMARILTPDGKEIK